MKNLAREILLGNFVPYYCEGCLLFQAEIIPIEPDSGNADEGSAGDPQTFLE